MFKTLTFCNRDLLSRQSQLSFFREFEILFYLWRHWSFVHNVIVTILLIFSIYDVIIRKYQITINLKKCINFVFRFNLTRSLQTPWVCARQFMSSDEKIEISGELDSSPLIEKPNNKPTGLMASWSNISMPGNVGTVLQQQVSYWSFKGLRQFFFSMTKILNSFRSSSLKNSMSNLFFASYFLDE